jgi:hypothetical protein
MQWGRGGSAAFGVMLAAMSAAHAQTICVRCTGPEATYRCQATAETQAAEDAIGLFCVSKLAKERGHQSCATERGAAECDGPLVEFAYDQAAAPEEFVAGAAGEAPPGGPPESGEPETLADLTEDAVDDSAKKMKKAGETLGDAARNAGQATTNALKGAGKMIGNATEKTLKCLGSALNDC